MCTHVCTYRYVHTYLDILHIGHRNLKEFTLKNVINALHDAGFADADCEQLGLQLDLSEQMENIR